MLRCNWKQSGCGEKGLHLEIKWEGYNVEVKMGKIVYITGSDVIVAIKKVWGDGRERMVKMTDA